MKNISKINVSKIFLFVCATVLLVCGDECFAYIKAATYFGSAWPLNFWNSNLSSVDSDFKKMRNDGFNAVILVVPWGEFQPGTDPVRYNDGAFKSLADVCRKAKHNNLGVYLRVSYLWDMYPSEQMPATERAKSLVSKDLLIPEWGLYLRKIKQATTGCSNGAFISWEDFWHIISVVEAAKPGAEAAEISREIGFDKWAENNAPNSFLKKYEQDRKKFGAYPVPSRKNTDFELVFRWFDDQIMNRLMPVLVKQLPNASIEARVDDDPIYDGDKLIKWYNHKKMYQVGSSPLLMTYWAPAMGAKNEGETEAASVVLQRFSAMQKKVLNETDNKIFIGQLLFSDNTPSAAKNAVINSNEIDDFIAKLSAPLMLQTSGYALWGYQDYDASVLYNGFFTQGKLGWDFTNKASVVMDGGIYKVQLPIGESISQNIPLKRDHFHVFAKKTTLRFVAQGPGSIEVYFGGDRKIINTEDGKKIYLVEFPVANSDTVFSIKSTQGVVNISDVYLFTFTQSAGVRDVMGNPAGRLPSIVKLNHAIDAGGGLPSLLRAEDKSLSEIKGVYTPEKSSTGWFSWASPDVRARIIPKSASINIKGYIKVSMYKTRVCKINVYVDDVNVISRKFNQDGEFNIPTPISARDIGNPVDLRLSSSCSIVPKREGVGEDDRNLSYIIKEIDAR